MIERLLPNFVKTHFVLFKPTQTERRTHTSTYTFISPDSSTRCCQVFVIYESVNVKAMHFILIERVVFNLES